jgi:hypothetical protein
MKEGEKYFLMPADNANIPEYAEAFDVLAADNTKDLILAVPPWAIEQNDISNVCTILFAAQHKKKWIEALLFSFNFKFLRHADAENDFLTDEEWKNKPAYRKWFHTMNQKMPLSLFFIKDNDARMFSLEADFLDDLLRVFSGMGLEGKKVKIEMPVEKLKLIDNRLFWSCIAFYTYCSGMHVNAQAYIEAIIAERGGGHFDFKHVHRDWLKNNYRIEPAKTGS